MDEKYTRIGIYKELTKLLWDYGFSKENAIMVLSALYSENEENLLKDFLETSSKLAESDIYDYMIQLTNGRFQKEFNSSRIAKRRYLMNPTEENMNILLAELGKSPIYTIEKWDITKEEETLFDGAEVGQTIQIESRRGPVLLEDTETEGILIPVYTSEMEMAADKKREYTVSTIPFQSMATYVCRLADSLKRNVGIVLDGDSRESLIIPGPVLAGRIP